MRNELLESLLIAGDVRTMDSRANGKRASRSHIQTDPEGSYSGISLRLYALEDLEILGQTM